MRRRVLDAVVLLVVAANGWHFAVCVCRYVSAHHRSHPLPAAFKSMM
jgi:hypothetical protein